MHQEKETETCNYCMPKFCRNSQNGDFEICQYGVSYIKLENQIFTREPNISVSTIAKNLRHEINPILHSIIEQTSKVDNSLSTKKIDLQNPLSLVIGNTVILDNFIQMITGIHDFHASSSNISTKKINVKETLKYYYDVYSIIKEDGRTETLRFVNNIPENLFIHEYSDFIKYMIVILVDNAWKYSKSNTELIIDLKHIEGNYYQIDFINISSIIPDEFDLFKLGNKVLENSKGFGYGLYWLKMLIESYNQLNDTVEHNSLEILHRQEKIDKFTARQKFSLKNLNLKTY